MSTGRDSRIVVGSRWNDDVCDPRYNPQTVETIDGETLTVRTGNGEGRLRSVLDFSDRYRYVGPPSQPDPEVLPAGWEPSQGRWCVVEFCDRPAVMWKRDDRKTLIFCREHGLEVAGRLPTDDMVLNNAGELVPPTGRRSQRTKGDMRGYDARAERPDIVAGCRLSCVCSLHKPPREPYICPISDEDLLPDA